MVLRLARFMAKTVPAYQAQLHASGLGKMAIRSMEAFRQLPVLDKATYIKTHSFEDLFPHRDMSAIATISSTSGSTGEPAYFPRGEAQDAGHDYVHELFLANQFEVVEKRTLCVVGFGLGIWIGGILWFKTVNRLAQKGYPISAAPVGPNLDTCLHVISRFGGSYDQILLIGYPPFIKDVLDEGIRRGIDWGQYTIKILMAAEGFSEEFRDYLATHAHLKNAVADTINIYGTVELGTMAHETALTTLIRRVALEHPRLYRALFPCANRIPTLAQYHPYLTYFEEVNGEVLASGYGSSIPLVRYRFPDRGGVIPFARMLGLFGDLGIDLLQEARKWGIERTIMRLPFVYVYERTDQALSLMGLLIYPEFVKAGLLHEDLRPSVTGKFTMLKHEDEQFNARFELHVELREGVAATDELTGRIQRIVMETLKQKSSEYGELARAYPQAATPHIHLWPFQDPQYFKPGGKQRWVCR
jgi:phenylacetate-CoA ligase